MKHRFLTLLLFFMASVGYAQLPKKYPFGDANFQAYFFCNPGKADLNYSQDSSKMYFLSCDTVGQEYGAMLVLLLDPVTQAEVAESLMISFIDYLKPNFDISKSVGYGKGHTLTKHPEVKGVIDYCEDSKGNGIKFKGWTDGKFICVMYVRSLTGPLKDENFNRNELFLNSLRLPGD